jgi:hypothetical protein
MLDSTSLTRLAGTLPELQGAAAQLHTRALAELGIDFTIPEYGGLRTEQDQAQLVAWRDEAVARGEPYYQVAPFGQSRHEQGGAFDALPKGATVGDATDPRLAQLGALGESIGLTWGGRWTGKKYDPWHFELALSWSDLVDAFASLATGDTAAAGELASTALATITDTVTSDPVAAGGAGVLLLALVVVLFFLR